MSSAYCMQVLLTTRTADFFEQRSFIPAGTAHESDMIRTRAGTRSTPHGIQSCISRCSMTCTRTLLARGSALGSEALHRQAGLTSKPLSKVACNSSRQLFE